MHIDVMFQHIYNKSQRMIYFIALLLYLIILVCVLTVFEEYDGVFLRFRFDEQGIYVLAADVLAVTLVLLLLRCYKGLKDCTWRAALLVFSLLVLLQILFTVFVSRPLRISDSACVSQEAMRMLQENTPRINMADLYFQRYGNNHFIVILFYWFYSLLSHFSITDYFIADIVLTIFMLDLGIYLSYRIVRLWRGQRDAVFFLLLCMLSPTTYLWLTFAYTTIFGIAFISAVLYLYLLMRKETVLWKNIALGVCFGMCAVWGFWLRAATFLLVLFSAFLQIVRRKLRDHSLLVLHLTLMGGILFFAIWEANIKYNITFMYIAFILMGDGAGKLPMCPWMFRHWMKKRSGTLYPPKQIRALNALIIAAALVLMASSNYLHEFYNEYHEKEIFRVPYGSHKKYLREMEKGGANIRNLTQTFLTDAYGTEWDEMKIAFYRTEKTPKHPYKKEWEWGLYSMPSNTLLKIGGGNLVGGSCNR